MFVLLVLGFANTYSADSKDTPFCYNPDPSNPLKKVFTTPRRGIEAVTHAHKKTNPKKLTKKVHWADEGKNPQKLAIKHELNPLDPEFMFQMHGLPLDNERNNRSKRAWYRQLSPIDNCKYQIRELQRRISTIPDGPEEKAVLDEIQRSGTKIKGTRDKNRHLKLEQLKEEDPALFEKKE